MLINVGGYWQGGYWPAIVRRIRWVRVFTVVTLVSSLTCSLNIACGTICKEKYQGYFYDNLISDLGINEVVEAAPNSLLEWRQLCLPTIGQLRNFAFELSSITRNYNPNYKSG